VAGVGGTSKARAKHTISMSQDKVLELGFCNSEVLANVVIAYPR
jgi:hypothetical protein